MSDKDTGKLSGCKAFRRKEGIPLVGMGVGIPFSETFSLKVVSCAVQYSALFFFFGSRRLFPFPYGKLNTSTPNHTDAANRSVYP